MRPVTAGLAGLVLTLLGAAAGARAAALPAVAACHPLDTCRVGGPASGNGRVDPGETLEQCLLRELHEEAGIEEARVVRELGRPTWPVKYENHAFEVHIAGGEPADTWDHVVQGDVNGDGKADFEISVNASLKSADFVL